MRTFLLSLFGGLGMCNGSPSVPPTGDTDAYVDTDIVVDTDVYDDTDLGPDTDPVLDSDDGCPENKIAVAFKGPPIDPKITLSHGVTMLSVCIYADEHAVVEGIQMQLVTSASTLVGVSGARIENDFGGLLAGGLEIPDGVGGSYIYEFRDEFEVSDHRPKCIDFVVDILGPFSEGTVFQATMIMEGLEVEDDCSGDSIPLDDMVPGTSVVGQIFYL